MNTPSEHSEQENGGLPPSDDVRAGEYVLGVLDALERRRTQQRIRSDAAFARLVDAWQERFAPWMLHVAPVEPPPQVWARVRTRLGWSPVAGTRGRLWNSVSFWRGAAALAVAAGLAAVVFVRVHPPSAPSGGREEAAHAVVVLARDDGSTGWLASVDTANGKLLMVPVPRPAAADGRVNELWLIAPGDAPRSLGLLSNEKTQTIVLPQALQRELAIGVTLAVTLEPPAGMPHAAPSGAIVAKGSLQEI